MITLGLGIMSIVSMGIICSLVIFLLIITSILWPINKIRNKKAPENLKAVKKLILKGYDAESRWITVNVSGNPCRVHYLISRGSSCKPTLVLLHGIDSAAIIWLPIWKQLQQRFQIIALDLPGFGQSACLPGFDHSMPPEALLSLYDQFFKTFCDTLQLSSILLVGHSFGAYLALSFAAAYPNYVQKLILVSPAGLLPTMDSYGYYWGALFYTSPIVEVVNKSGNLGKWVFDQFNNFVDIPLVMQYWYFINRQNNCGRDVFKRFMSFDIVLQQVQCIYPLFNKLATLQMSVGFVYGNDDTVTPMHQGIIIREILNPEIPVVAIPNTSHLVTKTDNPQSVYEAIQYSLDHSSKPKNSRCVFPREFFLQFKTVANPQESAKIVNDLYSKLRSICL